VKLAGSNVLKACHAESTVPVTLGLFNSQRYQFLVGSKSCLHFRSLIINNTVDFLKGSPKKLSLQTLY